MVVRHLALVAFVLWSVFAYRDFWPLATFTLRPADEAEGWLIWTKLALLSFVAVVVPLMVPRQYIPIDPQVSLWTPIIGAVTSECLFVRILLPKSIPSRLQAFCPCPSSASWIPTSSSDTVCLTCLLTNYLLSPTTTMPRTWSIGLSRWVVYASSRQLLEFDHSRMLSMWIHLSPEARGTSSSGSPESSVSEHQTHMMSLRLIVL